MGTQLRQGTAERLSRSPLAGVPNQIRQILALREGQRSNKAREDLTRRGQDISLLTSLARASATKKTGKTEFDQLKANVVKDAVGAVRAETGLLAADPNVRKFGRFISDVLQERGNVLGNIDRGIDDIFVDQLDETQRSAVKKAIRDKYGKTFLESSKELSMAEGAPSLPEPQRGETPIKSTKELVAEFRAAEKAKGRTPTPQEIVNYVKKTRGK